LADGKGKQKVVKKVLLSVAL
jgi:hypothetical protein